MEELGVISKINKSSQWCAEMVVFSKKNVTIRICVDLKPLNENVLQETYSLHGVDKTLAQLTGMTILSKLIANSRFWQMPLAEFSRPLTTFITLFEQYHFNKLPF